jgi:ribosomal protein L28
MSLKRRFKKITDKQKQNKKWFDANLHKVRGNLLNYGKIYSKFQKDPVVKNHFY